MHDTNHYDFRIEKLHQDIETSRQRAATLEEELRIVCEEWDMQYEETKRQVRQRVEEMYSGNVFEQIETTLS